MKQYAEWNQPLLTYQFYISTDSGVVSFQDIIQLQVVTPRYCGETL